MSNANPSRRRVVITGMGCITPMGTEVEKVWTRLKNSESSVDFTSIFDASNYPTKISSEVRNWDVTDVGEDAEFWKRRGRHSKFAAGAAKKAVTMAGIDDKNVEPTRFGVYLGSGEGQQDFFSFSKMIVSGLGGEQFDVAKFTKKGLEILDPI